jgi:hypothetical protein
MTPFELESLIDDHGTALEHWPAVEQVAARDLLAHSEEARTVLRRAERLEALLRAPDDGAMAPDDVMRVIARTRAAAYRTPQLPPPPAVRLRRWCAGLFAVPGDGLWRYGVPVTIGLVLGVLVGHASVDQVDYTQAEATPNVETLMTIPHAVEPFGL